MMSYTNEGTREWGDKEMDGFITYSSSAWPSSSSPFHLRAVSSLHNLKVVPLGDSIHNIIMIGHTQARGLVDVTYHHLMSGKTWNLCAQFFSANKLRCSWFSLSKVDVEEELTTGPNGPAVTYPGSRNNPSVCLLLVAKRKVVGVRAPGCRLKLIPPHIFCLPKALRHTI